MADYCSKCGKKLGILSGKYKADDGSVMCGSCFKEDSKRRQEELKLRREQEKQDKEKFKESVKEEEERWQQIGKKLEPIVKSITLELGGNITKETVTRKYWEKYPDEYKSYSFVGVENLLEMFNLEVEDVNELEEFVYQMDEEFEQKIEKNREIMRDYISKYLTNKDDDFRGYILLFRNYILSVSCGEYFYDEYIKIGMERYREEEHPEITEDETVYLAILKKAIEERRECVAEDMALQDLIYDDFRELKDLIGVGLLKYHWESSEDMEARRPQTIDHKTWNFLEYTREHYRELLNDAESSKKPGLSGSELEEITETIKMYEETLDFVDDFEKMYKLFKKKAIEVDHTEILSIFHEVIGEMSNKIYNASVEHMDGLLEPVYKLISIRLGDNISEENVIREFLKITGDAGVFTVSRLLEKFNFGYEQDEVEELIEKVKEEIELEEFEQNLGTSQQKQKIEIGDFTELNGYEFEEYLKNIFELLGYTAVQTSLSGDQGADLILSKDDEKIVVQAKKYDGKVSNKAVQEIAAAKNHYEANRAMIVTNSSFTKSAIELAFSNDVELWDGRKLKGMVRDLEDKGKDGGLASHGFHEHLHFNIGEEVQNVTMPCPFCEKEFDYEIDFHPYLELTEEGTYCGPGEHKLDINCPHCDFPLVVSFEVPLKPRWSCSFCGKKFETKAEAEEHEKTCEDRKGKG